MENNNSRPLFLYYIPYFPSPYYQVPNINYWLLSRKETEAQKSSSPVSSRRVTKKRKRDRTCFWCNTNVTPEWRSGPEQNTLCNACGLKYKKEQKQLEQQRGNKSNLLFILREICGKHYMLTPNQTAFGGFDLR